MYLLSSLLAFVTLALGILNIPTETSFASHMTPQGVVDSTFSASAVYIFSIAGTLFYFFLISGSETKNIKYKKRYSLFLSSCIAFTNISYLLLVNSLPSTGQPAPMIYSAVFFGALSIFIPIISFICIISSKTMPWWAIAIGKLGSTK